MRMSLMTACLALALACASAPRLPVASYLRSAEVEAPGYPRTQFVTAVGTSEASAGEAAARARAAATQQISASIRVQVDTWASSTTAGASSSDASKYLESIKLQSEFAHAELIRIAESASSGDTFYALAVLDRGEGEAALARDAAADQQRFSAAAERALMARHQRKAGEFSSAAAEAQQALAAVESSFVVRHALLRAASPAEREHVSMRNALIAALVEARARRVVDVRMEGAGNSKLLARAVAAVKRLGLRVAEGKGCSRAGSDTDQVDATELVLMPEESCGESSLGPLCKISVRVHARGCAGGAEGEGRVAQQKGAHSADPERARARAWEGVTDQLVDSAVQEALRGTLSAGATP